MSKYVWQVKNKKQEQVSGADPVQVMTDFGKKYGTRGEIRITRWAKTSGDMLTTTGVYFKGTFKSVVEQLKAWVIAHPAEASIALSGTLLSRSEQETLRKLAKKLKLEYSSLAARPAVARKYIAEYKEHGTVNGMRVQAAATKSIQAFAESLFGKASNKNSKNALSIVKDLYEDDFCSKLDAAMALRAANALAASQDADEVKLGKRVRANITGSKVTASKKAPVFKTNWTPMETKVLQVLRGVDADTGIELEELRKQLAGKALADLGKVPASVDKAIESLVRGYFAMKAKRGGVWYIVPVHVKGVPATAASKASKDKPRMHECKELEEVYGKVRKLKGVPEAAALLKEVTTAAGLYLDAVSGDLPEAADVSQALMDIITEVRTIESPNIKELGTEMIKAYRSFKDNYISFLKSAVASLSATAVAGEGVDFVGNAVIGDLKRIRSLIDTWSKKKGKGAMDKESLEKYVEYQKDVAAYIVRKYMPKLSASYQAKVKAI